MKGYNYPCRKGKNNPNFGRKYSLKIRKKMSRNHKDYSGENNPSYKDGRTLKDYFCKKCGKKISISSGIYGKCLCQSCVGKINQANLPIKGWIGTLKSGRYKNIWMRSSWEIKFAQFLDLSNIRWIYEPRVFNLGNTRYLPDFYIPEFDCYIEIKGYWNKKSKTAFKKFKRLYPEKTTYIFYKKDLQMLGVL